MYKPPHPRPDPITETNPGLGVGSVTGRADYRTEDKRVNGLLLSTERLLVTFRLTKEIDYYAKALKNIQAISALLGSQLRQL